MDNNEQTVEAWLCERFKYHLQINHKPSKVEIAKMKNDIPMSRGFVWIDNPPIRFSDGVICNPFCHGFYSGYPYPVSSGYPWYGGIIYNW